MPQQRRQRHEQQQQQQQHESRRLRLRLVVYLVILWVSLFWWLYQFEMVSSPLSLSSLSFDNMKALDDHQLILYASSVTSPSFSPSNSPSSTIPIIRRPKGEDERLSSSSSTAAAAAALRQRLSNLQTILEQSSSSSSSSSSLIRYYVYDDPELTLPAIRQLAQDGTKPKWSHASGPKKWGARFVDYAKWDLVHLQALELNPNGMRTLNLSEADFVLVPIPFGASLVWSKSRTKSERWTGQNPLPHVHALKYLFDKKYPVNDVLKKQVNHPQPLPPHVILCTMEYMFTGEGNELIKPYGFWGHLPIYMQALNHLTIVRWHDAPLYGNTLATLGDSTLTAEWIPKWFQPAGVTKPGVMARHKTTLLLKRTWSISYAGAASHFGGKGQVTFQNLWQQQQSLPRDAKQGNFWKAWQAARPLYFFYHTTRQLSVHNSTRFRHAPCLVNETLQQPSSVGFDISPQQWVWDFSRSRFCLAIRGDNPNTRSLHRAIRNGCLPVIVIDLLPYFAPMFRSLLKYSDFAVVVKESEFIVNPVRALHRAVFSPDKLPLLQAKLEGLALVQRIVVPDHPDSLFVPAFCQETMASLRPDYTNYSAYNPW